MSRIFRSIFSAGTRLLLVAFLSTAYGVKAQTGPAGVGNSSTNRVWLDAGRLTGYSNGAKVNQWTDASGNNWHAVQGNVNNQPRYVTNSLNGRPVLNFNRSQVAQFLQVSATGAGSLMSNSNTLFAVAMTTSGGANDYIEAYQSILVAPGWHNCLSFHGYPNTNIILSYQWLGGSMPARVDPTGNITTHIPITQGNWYMPSRVNLGTATSTSSSTFINGALVKSETKNLPMTVYGDVIRIGAGNLPGSTYVWPLNGNIAEIILYNTNLNDAQRIIVDNYLSAKYNLTIANKYYTDNGDYNQDVQGIGTTNGVSKHSQAANGKGLLLTEVSSSLNGPAAEFLFAGHNTAANSLVRTEFSGPAIEQWQRSWYVHKTGSIDAKLSFDWSESGLPAVDLSNTYASYVLLYRPDLQSAFRAVSRNGAVLAASLENGDQLGFALADGELQTGYYTVGKRGDFVWTGAVSSEWHTAGNWSGNRVPAAGDYAIVPACATCPVLSAPVQVGSLLVEEGQLDVRNFTVSAAAATRLISARILSNGGTLQAASFGEVKRCNFEGNIFFRKTGSTNDAWYGDNAYRGKVTVLNSGTGGIAAAAQANDVIVE